MKVVKYLKNKKPIICEVFTSENQTPLFKQKYIKNHNDSFQPISLDDMYP